MIKSILLGIILIGLQGLIFKTITSVLDHYQIIEYYNDWVVLGFWFGAISTLINLRVLLEVRKNETR